MSEAPFVQTDITDYPELGPLQAAQNVPAYIGTSKICRNSACPHDGTIGMVNYDGFCSVDCRKSAGIDHPDYGKSEMMLVTRDEASQIKANRA